MESGDRWVDSSLQCVVGKDVDLLDILATSMVVCKKCGMGNLFQGQILSILGGEWFLS